ncbi:hypothetical protein AVEN_240435-1 [Araneus ventricosus]|uniref:Uncharacterized protein n=1 Tax=Araneus ventricosus TaxID=182803 RepID=A0A4Y2MI70_ARAVE|nr:hypothetical protein AVEN_240435-1 [Araneus ventricosus]
MIHHRNSFHRRCFRLTRGHNAFSSSEFRFRIFKTNTTEVALSLFTFSSHISFLFPPFLNTLPSKAREVVDELPPGDPSSSWTNHPTAVVCLPSWCSLDAVNLNLRSLSAYTQVIYQKKPHSAGPCGLV